MSQTVNNSQNNEDIDLLQFFLFCCRNIRKHWILMGIYFVALSGLVLGIRYLLFTPLYRATIEYSVECADDAYVDSMVAARISGSVEAVTATSEFKNQLLQTVEDKMGKKPEKKYTIESSYTTDSSLMVISVTSENAYEANQLLWGMEQIYPEWVARTIGKLDMNIINKVQSDGRVVNRYARKRVVIESCLAGLAVLLGLLLYSFLKRKNIQTEEDMKTITSAECMGIVPEILLKKRVKSDKLQLVIDNEHIDWVFKQSIESTRKRIETQMNTDGNKVLLITSTIPEEGKSITAINLAKSFTEHRKKVIIIDGDLRGSGIKRMLKVRDIQPGLSDYLVENTSHLPEIMLHVDGLCIIPAGTIEGNAADLMDKERMCKLMDTLKARFDVIIIDTPPSLFFADAGILAEYADKVIYIVRHNLAEKNDIAKGMELYIQTHKLSGYILNRFSKEFQRYGSYYGSYYGNAYGSYYSHYGHYGYDGNQGKAAEEVIEKENGIEES